MSAPAPIEQLPGFRRRFQVRVEPGCARGALEDDLHCMSVTVEYDDEVATRVEGTVHRAPWTTCPNASLVLERTFTGVRLADFAERGEKRANCTHLHDLAVLLGSHILDNSSATYDMYVADPEDGVSRAELRRDGETLLAWTHARMAIAEPEALAGGQLLKPREWIGKLAPELRAPARMLAWACLVAHGRVIPMAEQSDATRMPPNCYTFQPERAQVARRVGEVRDFSAGQARPLDRFTSEHTDFFNPGP